METTTACAGGEADDVLDLLGEFWIGRAFERAQSMRLEPMFFPKALHGAQRNPCGPGHGAAGPMGGGARWRRAGQLQNSGDDFLRERRASRLACLVAQQTVDALFGIAQLPPPDRQTAGRLTPARRATSRTGSRPAEWSTIFAR